MKDLIICEKPNLAGKVCAGLKRMNQHFTTQDGYYESDDYIVTFAFGHLFELYDIEMYSDDYDSSKSYSWVLDNLPFIPDNQEFRFALKRKISKNSEGRRIKTTDSGVKKQFGIISKLIHRDDIRYIINCGDADREGEIIIRLILSQAKNTKPVYRLWLEDQTPETVAYQMKNLKEDALQNNIANEGYARMYADWLWGINYTRFASIKSQTQLNVGRVISAIVWAIYLRDKEIGEFLPVQYYGLKSEEESNGEVITLNSKLTFEYDRKDDADQKAALYNSLGASVSDVKKERKMQKYPKLFSQSTLQIAMSKRYKFEPFRTLATVQSLYEKGFVTYPRTNTEYLSENEKSKAEAIIKALKKAGFDDIEFRDSKSIFNSAKIESHSAVTPTTHIPSLEEFNALSSDEKLCYETIRNRFLAVFCREECIIDETVIEIKVGQAEGNIEEDNGELFTLKGKVLVNEGWRKYDEPLKDKVLPALEIGQKVSICFKAVDKQTEPPKHYTVDEMINYLVNPFRTEKKMTEDEHYKAILDGIEIGTEATRPDIIKRAIDIEYIALNNQTYTILPKGKFMCETLKHLNVDMSKEKTVELSRMLKQVRKDELSISDVLDAVYRDMEQNIEHSKELAVQKWENIKEKETLGRCPVCGNDVVEHSRTYSCSDKECSFVIWKENAFFQKLGVKKITSSMVKSFLNKGSYRFKGLEASESSRLYDATFKMEYDRENRRVNFRMADEIIGHCPKCGRDVIEVRNFIVCSGNRKDDKQCDFFMSKEQKFFEEWTGKKITTSQIRSLLKNRKIEVKCLKKDGTGTYPACVNLVSAEKDGREFWGLRKENIDFSSIEKEIIGNCPRCGSLVHESEKSFYCSNKDCRFALWKENRYFEAFGKKITKSMAKGFLKNGKTTVKEAISKKTGKKLENITFVMNDNPEGYTNFEIQFSKGAKRNK